MAIHRDRYTAYDGPLADSGGWWVIAAHTIKSMVGLLRTKLIIPTLWIGPLIAAVAVVAEMALYGQTGGATAPGGGEVTLFLQMQFHALAVLLMASGAGVVSHDMRYNTLQLFFSKPIERWEYTLGKFVGLMVIGSTVTVLPAIAVGGLRTAMLYQHGMAKAVGIDAAIGVGLSLMLTALLSMLMIGLSSMTRRTGLVILTFIGVLFFPPVASIILGLTVDNGDIAGLASLQGNLQMLSDVLVTDRTLEIPVWSPGLLLAVVTGGAYGLHHWRLRSLEGVS